MYFLRNKMTWLTCKNCKHGIDGYAMYYLKYHKCPICGYNEFKLGKYANQDYLSVGYWKEEGSKRKKK